ncbi:MAG: hypothetical protein A3I66_23305 [Burkholderiales bacterium RIFCSPLOWO2_02_FULL_57_36]|nr:MAG: hypothetical protein A3I66_23305 [Burkholderiales bacterium RIFCSPLOWO2_02_FULL_57_36]
MSALRCTQKLRTAMNVKPAFHSSEAPNLEHAPVSTARLGDWTMNLLHVRPAKLILAVSEHDRLGLLMEAAPYATLSERFTEALFAHLLTLGVPPDIVRCECSAMQPLTITATTHYENRRSIQGNMTDYTLMLRWLFDERMPMAEMNARLAEQISKPTGHQYPGELARRRLCGGDVGERG